MGSKWRWDVDSRSCGRDVVSIYKNVYPSTLCACETRRASDDTMGGDYTSLRKVGYIVGCLRYQMGITWIHGEGFPRH